jgi:Ras-related protein Rab-1A
MNIADVDFIFKVLIIGDSSVGKSNILLRFSDNVFHDTFLPTIGVDFKIKNVSLSGQSIKLNIWDTAGQERFKTITAAYYKGSHGVILVYDITDRESFNNIVNWLAEVRKHAGPNVARVLVGNKCDLTAERKVTEKEAKEFAEQQGMQFFEASAKAKINIEETFMAITKTMYEQLPEGERRAEGPGIGLGNARGNRGKENGGCC